MAYGLWPMAYGLGGAHSRVIGRAGARPSRREMNLDRSRFCVTAISNVLNTLIFVKIACLHCHAGAENGKQFVLNQIKRKFFDCLFKNK